MFRRKLSSLNSQPSTLDSPRGFTLLEVLVALGLSVMLLAAVYGAINLSYNLTAAGRVQMEEAQLVRALFQQIDTDVRSVVFAIQEQVASESDEAAEEETTAVVVEPMTTDDAFANESNGVYGDPQNLVLHVSRPSRPSVFVAADVGTEGAGRSDLAAVSYFLAVQGASGLPGVVARMAHQGSLLNMPRTGTVTGLTRLEGDRLAVQFASDTGDLETLAASAQILAPEVVSLSFAFWDGVEWTDSWDTLAVGALPAAIEITVGIDTAVVEEQRSGRSRNTGTLTLSGGSERQPRMYRHVVALPLSEPYVGALSQ